VGWMPVSAELFELLVRARRVSELTDGAFEITYASVGRFCDYREGRRPDDETLRTALDAIDYRYVRLDAEAGWVRFDHDAVYVDLGGIAKGYAVDRCIELLAVAEVVHTGVSAGGDSRMLGDRRGRPWSVGVRHPRAKGEMAAVLPLTDTAVSTSGDYERFFERDGVRYHHILDPDTGRAVPGSMSVTVLGPDATFTDAPSTSVFVLGSERVLQLIDRLSGIDAIVVDSDGRMHISQRLESLSP